VYFTRSDTGFRVWFQVVRNNGLLRTDITGSDFTALVVDASDTTSSQMVVTQSQQKAGLYRFDVPSVFLVSNGSGEYGVSVELDTSSPPHVTTAFSEILKVSEDDFNSLSGSIQIGEVSASFTVDVDSIVSGVWEANRLNFTSSVDSFGWTVDRMFQTQSLTYQNTVDLVFSSSQIFNIITDISGNIDDLVYSSSQVFDNTELLIASGSSEVTQASINNIVSGVWSAVTSTFNLSGTMGYIQNQTFTNSTTILQDTLLLISGVNAILGQTTDIQNIVASGSVEISLDSINTFVSSVWQANDVTFNTSGTMGFLQNLIDDIRFDTSQTLNNTTNIANGVTASLTTESIASVVSGVWSAASGVYDASGTMGFLQNQIGATEISASVSINEQAIANAVWNTLTSSMTTSGSAGAVLFTQTDALATKICEIYQILGLELGAPLTVSDVQRTVAAITQSISCVGDVVTVTRTS